MPQTKTKKKAETTELPPEVEAVLPPDSPDKDALTLIEGMVQQIKANSVNIKAVSDQVNFLAQNQPNLHPPSVTGTPPGRGAGIGSIIQQVFSFLTQNPDLLKGGQDDSLLDTSSPKFKELQGAWIDNLITQQKNQSSISDADLQIKNVDLQLKKQELKRMTERQSRFGRY